MDQKAARNEIIISDYETKVDRIDHCVIESEGVFHQE